MQPLRVDRKTFSVGLLGLLLLGAISPSASAEPREVHSKLSTRPSASSPSPSITICENSLCAAQPYISGLLRRIWSPNGDVGTHRHASLLARDRSKFTSNTRIWYKAEADSLIIAQSARAVRQGNYDEAIARLAPLVNSAPIPRHPTYGSAATWLGQAFAERGNSRQALNVWLSSLQRDRQTDDGPPPADAAHALLQLLPTSVLRQKSDLVSRVYQYFLEILSTPEAARGTLSLPADTILRKRVARLALIAPDSLSGPLSTYAASPPQTNLTASSSLSPDSLARTAENLQDWLRAQDPILATEANERIPEHLKRVREAQERYAWDGRPSDLDDRGEVYVQYGPPDFKTSVTFQAGSTEYTFGGVTIPPLQPCLRTLNLSFQSFPAAKNEVWRYPEMTPDLHFIFVRENGEGHPYMKGTARDLLPSSVRARPHRRRSLTRVECSEVWKAYFSLYSAVFKQLRWADPRYETRLSRLRAYKPAWHGSLKPYAFTQRQLAEYTAQNRRMENEREDAPNQRTTYALEQPELPVAVRTARFLEENGKTRVEVYWNANNDAQTDRGSGVPSSDSTLVQTTGVLRSSSLGQVDRVSRAETFTHSGSALPQKETSQTLMLRGPGARHSLEIEWLQYPLRKGGQKGSLARTTRQKIGPQPALSTNPAELEMSDVRLLSVPSDRSLVPQSEDEVRRRVIAHQRVDVGHPLALNFDVYRLSYDSTDRTRYSVKYTTEYSVDREGLPGLFGAKTKRSTSTSSVYQGRSRNPSEHILFEPDALFTSEDRPTLTEPVPVTVTVRVTDKVTGQFVERSISFTYVPSTSDEDES